MTKRNRHPLPPSKPKPAPPNDVEQAARAAAQVRADLAEKEVKAILEGRRCVMQVEQVFINGILQSTVIRFVPLQ